MAMDRLIEITTPLGQDALLFRRMRGSERLGRLFDYRIELLSHDDGISLDDLLGQEMTVRLQTQGGGERIFHGHVSRFCQTGRHVNYTTYEARLRPWLWFLTRTADCRIYQQKTVPDIVKEVFREHGFNDFDESLTGSYREWEYVVQYRETDFDFVSRLLEHEGIYYFFRHADGKHRLVLCDSSSAHDPLPGQATIEYHPPSENLVREEDHIEEWRITTRVQPGVVKLCDYDFLVPKKNMMVAADLSRSHDKGDYEIFEYPGCYVQPADGDEYVRSRIEELQAEHEVVRAGGNPRGLFTGGLFELAEHPREDQNREYLVTAASYELYDNAYETGAESAGGAGYRCRFSAIDSRTPFRAARRTPKPRVYGPQTAVGTGPSGEEIYTDEHGRVKVQFHWDRYGGVDENSSCWVRVASSTAGKNWGQVAIPRIGQEVIVEFLEGDPDRPIITGRVYNADNMPPYELPGNKTQSGFKSRSSKGGTPDDFNEIRFEDMKGEEEMYIHAQKDQNSLVENDQGIYVGNDRAEKIERDRSLDVGRDKSEAIGRDKSITVAKGHSEQIGANMTINVGSNLTETVAINYAETVGAAMELSVGAALTITVGASVQQSVGGMRTENIGAGNSLTIGKEFRQKVGQDKVVDIAKDYNEDIGGLHRQTVKKEMEVTAKKIQLVAKDELNVKVGSAQLVLKKNGDITLKGKKINIKGSGDVIVKGSKIKEN